MPRKQRVRLTTGRRPNLNQANFGGIIANSETKGEGSSSDKNTGQLLKENRHTYRTIRRILFDAGYSVYFNPDPDHDCYIKKVTGRITFFVHLPSGWVTENKPAHKWFLRMYAATLEVPHNQHNRIATNNTFGINFIQSHNPQGFLCRLERKLISRLEMSKAITKYKQG